jgi:hypothetical protein
MVQKHTDYTVNYNGEKIVLEGASDAIHVEAEKIVRRFAYSPNPYAVETNSEFRVVLAAKN